jgi:hypothetical protein
MASTRRRKSTGRAAKAPALPTHAPYPPETEEIVEYLPPNVTLIDRDAKTEEEVGLAIANKFFYKVQQFTDQEDISLLTGKIYNHLHPKVRKVDPATGKMEHHKKVWIAAYSGYVKDKVDMLRGNKMTAAQTAIGRALDDDEMEVPTLKELIELMAGHFETTNELKIKQYIWMHCTLLPLITGTHIWKPTVYKYTPLHLMEYEVETGDVSADCSVSWAIAAVSCANPSICRCSQVIQGL